MILEHNIGMFGFAIFIGIIITLILMCVWGVFKDDNDDDKRNNKNSLYGYNSMHISNSINSSRNNNNNNHHHTIFKDEELIEDLIICDMLGLL